MNFGWGGDIIRPITKPEGGENIDDMDTQIRIPIYDLLSVRPLSQFGQGQERDADGMCSKGRSQLSGSVWSPWASPGTLLHPWVGFGKWNNTTSWGFHEAHRWKVFVAIFGTNHNSYLASQELVAPE